MFLMGFEENPDQRWYVVYLQGVSIIYLCTCGMTYISRNRPTGNKWPSWSDTENIANYITLNYGSRAWFGRIHTFFINVYNSLHISCFTSYSLCKLGWWTNYYTQTSNWYETFGIKYRHYIFLCVVQKTTAYVKRKALKMIHQPQRGFWGISVGIP